MFLSHHQTQVQGKKNGGWGKINKWYIRELPYYILELWVPLNLMLHNMQAMALDWWWLNGWTWPVSPRWLTFSRARLAWLGPGGGGGGGHSTFFQVGVCGPDFQSVGLANWHSPLKRGGGLWVENFQIWGLVSWKFPNLGLVSWKFPNLGACELKFGWKLRLLRLKFPNFLKRGSCELTLLLEMGPLRAAGEAWKGDLQGRTSPYPLSRSVPPPRG